MSKELENEFDKREASAVAKRMLTLVNQGADTDNLTWSPSLVALLGNEAGDNALKQYLTYSK